MSLVDLGKKLLDSARIGETEDVRLLMGNGAPFTTDWVSIVVHATNSNIFGPCMPIWPNSKFSAEFNDIAIDISPNARCHCHRKDRVYAFPP